MQMGNKQGGRMLTVGPSLAPAGRSAACYPCSGTCQHIRVGAGADLKLKRSKYQRVKMGNLLVQGQLRQGGTRKGPIMARAPPLTSGLIPGIASVFSESTVFKGRAITTLRGYLLIKPWTCLFSRSRSSVFWASTVSSVRLTRGGMYLSPFSQRLCLKRQK